MATTVAELGVDVSMNLAKLYQGVEQATNAVNKAAKSMKEAFDGVGGSLVNLAAGVVSVGAVMHGLKSSLEFGDQLQTMSERVGINVEKLQELSGIAVQSGTSLEAFGKSFKFLGDAMIKSGDATSKQAQLFGALGVNTKDAAGNLRSVDDVMGDTADALNSIGNETVRTAAGVAIFGKSYLEIAPALRTYREAQEAANAIMAEFGTVSATATRQADTFGDKINLLGQGFKAATLNGLTSGLAALNSALDSVTPTVAILAKAFGDFFGGLATYVAAALINVTDFAKKVGTALAALAASIATGSLQPLRELSGEIAKLEQERQAAIGRLTSASKFAGLDDSDQVSRFNERGKVLADTSKKVADALKPVNAEAAKLRDVMTGLLEPLRSLIDSLGKENEALEAQIAHLQQYGTALKATATAAATFDLEHGKMAESLAALSAVYPALAELMRAQVLAQARLNDTLKIGLQVEKEYADAMRKHSDAAAASVQAIIDETAKEEQLAEEFGKTRAEIVGLTIARNNDRIAQLAGIDGMDDEIAAIQARNVALGKYQAAVAKTDYIKDQAAQWSNFYNTISAEGEKFLLDFAQHGTSAFKRLWDDFVTWALAAIAKVATQQIILSIAGQVAPGSGIASGIGGGGLGSLGDIFKIFGGGGGNTGSLIAGIFGEAGATFGAAAGAGMAAGVETLSIAAAAGAEMVGGMAAVAGAMASFVPVIGAIAVAGYALYNYLESKKGGPKEAGFGGIGNISEGPGQFFPNEYTAGGNEAAQKLVDSLQKGFIETIKKLGGKPADFGFALGFDTDPQGKAASRVIGGVYQGGANIYKNINANVGRSSEELSAELQKQAQQMLLAALQASELPKAVAALLNSVDVAAASSDEIAAILATAQAIYSVAEAFPALQAQIENLKPEEIKAFIDALGGTDSLVATFGYLQKNFTLTADTVKENTDKLTADFASLNLAVPTTHQGFLDLLSSFDLTTEAGRDLYASVAALAPEFIAVAGSADEAAKKLQDATAFFRQNFYSDAEKSASALAEATRQLDAAQASLGITIPRSAEAFRALVESIDRTTPAGEALYAALLAVAPQILAVSGGLKTLTTAAAAAIPVISSISTVFGDIGIGGPPKIKPYIEKLRDLAKEAGGGIGDQLKFMVDIIGQQIEGVKKQMADALAVGDLWTYGALRNLVESLDKSNQQITAELAHYITLAAQYDDAKAEQLVNLEKWYADQQKLYKGDAIVLDALAKIFARKWDEIIKGTSDAVDGATGELDRLRQSIANWLKSLQLSDLSPLTPQQKLAEANAQYQDALAKAAAGDPEALADITKFADNYLKQARDFYASSPLYTEIFKRITEELGALAGTTPQGGPGPHGPGPEFGGPPTPATDLNSPLINALPAIGSKLVSADDLKRATDQLAKVLTDALAAVADAATQDHTATQKELVNTAARIVDGLGGNLK